MYAAKQYIQRFCTSVLFCCIHESFCVFRYFLKKKGKGDFVMALVIELFLLGVGLSMDAFAVSVCKGLGMRKLNKKQALIIGLYFGGFQALMPFVGWLLGSQFQKYITSIDHWIAFILLGFIGGKMMIEAVREWNEEEVVDVMDAPIDHKNMLVLAVATSIDALTVGITFAFLGTPIVEAITIIGIIRLPPDRSARADRPGHF